MLMQVFFISYATTYYNMSSDLYQWNYFYFESNTKLELQRKLLNIAPKTSSKFKECQFFLVGWQHSATSNNSSLFILFYQIYIVKEDTHHFIKIKMCLNVGLFLQFSKHMSNNKNKRMLSNHYHLSVHSISWE